MTLACPQHHVFRLSSAPCSWLVLSIMSLACPWPMSIYDSCPQLVLSTMSSACPLHHVLSLSSAPCPWFVLSTVSLACPVGVDSVCCCLFGQPCCQAEAAGAVFLWRKSLACPWPMSIYDSCPQLVLSFMSSVCPQHHVFGLSGWSGQRLLLSVWPALLQGCSSRGRLPMEEIPSLLTLYKAGEGMLLVVPSVVTLNTSIMAGFSTSQTRRRKHF